MRLDREVACAPDAFLAVVERRFLRECAEHGVKAREVAQGLGYVEDATGLSVRVTAHERGSVFAWLSRMGTEEVFSSYEVQPTERGCRVLFSREVGEGKLVGGGLAEALLLGRMSNELLDVQNEALGRDCTQGEKDGGDPGFQRMSVRLLRRLVDREGRSPRA